MPEEYLEYKSLVAGCLTNAEGNSSKLCIEIRNGCMYYPAELQPNTYHAVNISACNVQRNVSTYICKLPGHDSAKWIEIKCDTEVLESYFASLMIRLASNEVRRSLGSISSTGQMDDMAEETLPCASLETSPTKSESKTTSGHWRYKFEEVANKRCDLDILLKDEWRHKVVVRDNLSITSWMASFLRIDGGMYTALHATYSGSFEAVVLCAFHLALGAYGHGSHTAVAFIDDIGGEHSNLVPTIADHAELATHSCAEAIEHFAQTEWQLAPISLLQQGLFDAVLVAADSRSTLSNLPLLPLFAVVQREDGCLHWTLHYADALFEPEVILGLLGVVLGLLSQLVMSTTLVKELELVSVEQQRQLSAWNATDGIYPSTKCLNNLFEDAAARTPNLVAVISGGVEFTYREFDSQANRLARWLLEPPVRLKPNDTVALYLDKSYLTVLTIIAIWKAGAAFVPIDASYSSDRVCFILRDTKARCIIANQHHSAQLQATLTNQQLPLLIVSLESVLPHLPEQSDCPVLNTSSLQLAYVTYTSGTTGIPKGVAKQHFRVVNSITDLSERYNMKRAGEERVALFSSYVFEPFMRQMLIALINSQTLMVISDSDRVDALNFNKMVEERGITYLNATKSVLQTFDLIQCSKLKKIMLVGEELTSSGLRQLQRIFRGLIVNEYGFTESAFVTAIKEFPPTVTKRVDRSIGRPLRNVKCYVLNGNLKQLPIGAIGDLYIGGLGLSTGYLNRGDLTAERFLDNPFQSAEERRCGENSLMYKTGDLARMLPSGEVEYMGRSDFQLKINGARIEPGEIEAIASEFPGVKKCVVVARDTPTGRFLVGYFIAEPNVVVLEAAIIRYLEERLLSCMVPSRMIELPYIPVNINGKVDWRALPDIVTPLHGLL